ncbi:MAG: MFS transporter [Clostridiales bacterium]|nr:MFS transporter [Clostridiales bacterium]
MTISQQKIVYEEGEETKDEKLWNLSFILLWQGQLVSSYGNSVYKIALGFWILAETGSTAIMGLLMATMVLPSIFVSPLAGTFVDRHNRKWVIVLTDTIRGIVTLFIGVTALLGLLEVWMVLVGGIVLGVCDSLFKPAVHSVLPDILSIGNLVKGNSAISLASKGMDILGKSTGGILLQIIGAPFLFLINGLSFIMSAISECYIKIPVIHKEIKETHILTDLKVGFNYVKNHRGLKYLYIIFAFLNFFAVMGLTLILPLFNSRAYLGSGRYGITMAFLSGGMFLSFFLLSTIDIQSFKKSKLFTMCGMISGLSIAVLPLTSNYYVITSLIFANGLTFAVVSMLLQSTMQATVSKDMLGKTSGFERAISSSLMPLGMIVGGIMAEFTPIEYIISADFVIILVLFGLLNFIRPVTELLDGY